MYEAFFQLNSRPFPSTPRIDRYFPASTIENSRQTLARCIERAEGPGLLVGGPGTGKSLACSLLAEQFRDRFHVVKLDHARFCTRRALLQAVMFELNLPYRGLDEGELRLAMIEFAKSPDAGRAGLLLIIDEAQTLPVRLIEEVRMITNVVVGGESRLRLVLSGNSSLEERLSSPKLESLSQRIAARCYLQPLNYDETAAYTRAQLSAAGGDPDRIMTGDIWSAVYHATGGIPRLINQVCDHALMLAAVARRPALDAAVIEEAWADLQQLPLPWPAKTSPKQAAETVVEFGALATGEDDDARCEGGVPETDLPERELLESGSPETDLPERELLESGSPETDLPERELPQREPPEPTAATRPEIIDLTSQLEQIELHVAEWDSPEITTADDVAPDAEPATLVPSAGQTDAVRAENPFGDCFEEEETILDHYALLEAKSRLLGKGPLSPLEHEFTAAVQTIFQPLTEDRGSARPPVSDDPDTAATFAAPQEINQPAEADDEAAIAAVVEDDKAFEDIAPHDEPATLRVAALRDLPPDDSDLIVVMDAEARVGQLRQPPGKAHRQEYRRLFTKLRER